MSTISLRDALQHMDQGNPFSCTYVTWDNNRKRGGKIINLFHAKCIGRSKIHGTFRYSANGGSQIREGHIRLITHFNNQEVTW